MIKINNIKELYKTLNRNTKHIIRITLTTTLTLVVLSVIAYTSNNFELIKICDDILEASKSVMFIGFIGALFFEYIHKHK